MEDLKNIKILAEKEINSARNSEEIKQIFQKYLGKNGEVTRVLRSLKNLDENKKRSIGKLANQIKQELEQKIEIRKKEIGAEIGKNKTNKKIDVSFPGHKLPTGHLHPITKVKREVEDIFERLGFSVVEGPEVESEWYNFDALNIPANHPARDMWDTFWLRQNESKVQNSKSKANTKSQRLLLRTHTSPVQIRYMEKNNPPLRIIAPGRAFRYEATDASHEINFYHVEGLMVDKEISAANLKAIMEKFFEMFFKKSVKIRIRPSFFPFTEPSFEIDIRCLVCGGKGCSVCSQGGWLEIAGAGMVHPQVFKSAGLNPKEWQGFAFGMGLDRLTMMKYKIKDIRLLFKGDLRFLEQF
ncbi:MAG: phenylalanine--tRNA ligase subunit alpha [Candidatus Parcubacteria bacterium]|nr:phenylalanine--tRNA ligase subunit alpha [Candidatus Parcubacteria bacterium]